jgi:hypothetical protein
VLYGSPVYSLCSSGRTYLLRQIPHVLQSLPITDVFPHKRIFRRVGSTSVVCFCRSTGTGKSGAVEWSRRIVETYLNTSKALRTNEVKGGQERSTLEHLKSLELPLIQNPSPLQLRYSHDNLSSTSHICLPSVQSITWTNTSRASPMGLTSAGPRRTATGIASATIVSAACHFECIR